jgi:L-asparaginase
MPMSRGKERVVLVTTGGTIDSVGMHSLDLSAYSEAGRRLTGEELLSQVPELARVADVELLPFRQTSSNALTTDDWLQLSAEVTRISTREDVSGIVVTHGTGMLEETAYFLDLTAPSHVPVVVTGAMRPANGISADGPLNLVNAARTAVSERAVGLGVLVVMNDEIITAQDVFKSTTHGVGTFKGRPSGAIGFVSPDGEVLFYHALERRSNGSPLFDVSRLTAIPRVDVVLSYLGADSVHIDASIVAGAKGLVSAGAGGGLPTTFELEAFGRAINQGIVVCQASRSGDGRVVRKPRMTAAGIVSAGTLTPWKARILLALALTRTTDAEEIQRVFSGQDMGLV